jgi:hypothetical protein
MRAVTVLSMVLAVLTAGACGDDDDNTTDPPLGIELGETTLVAFVNPIVNATTSVNIPAPGTLRSGLAVSWNGGTSVTTDATGIAVLSDITPGTGTLAVSGSGLSGTLSTTIPDKDLEEVAVVLNGNGVTTMASVRYAFGGEVVEITPSQAVSQVNAQLARSNVVVLLRGGTYRGDLRFTGSNVTLFGAGVRGGEVTIDGNVVIEGSSNRIRGARISGNLTVTGSNAGVSFSRVGGTANITGSGAVLLNNAFCGQSVVIGSNMIALNNAGLSPIPASAGC